MSGEWLDPRIKHSLALIKKGKADKWEISSFFLRKTGLSRVLPDSVTLQAHFNMSGGGPRGMGGLLRARGFAACAASERG